MGNNKQQKLLDFIFHFGWESTLKYTKNPLFPEIWNSANFMTFLHLNKMNVSHFH